MLCTSMTHPCSWRWWSLRVFLLLSTFLAHGIFRDSHNMKVPLRYTLVSSYLLTNLHYSGTEHGNIMHCRYTDKPVQDRTTSHHNWYSYGRGYLKILQVQDFSRPNYWISVCKREETAPRWPQVSVDLSFLSPFLSSTLFSPTERVIYEGMIPCEIMTAGVVLTKGKLSTFH